MPRVCGRQGRAKPGAIHPTCVEARPAPLPQELVALANLFGVTFSSLDECVVVGDVAKAGRLRPLFPDDPVGLEALVNHVYLEDLFHSMVVPKGELRRALVKIGQTLISVWHERMAPLLDGREVIFYLGGRDTVAIRFHLVRDSSPSWLDLSDASFVRRERVRVFRGSPDGLERVC